MKNLIYGGRLGHNTESEPFTLHHKHCGFLDKFKVQLVYQYQIYETTVPKGFLMMKMMIMKAGP
jgi:hypothetical protein